MLMIKNNNVGDLELLVHLFYHVSGHAEEKMDLILTLVKPPIWT